MSSVWVCPKTLLLIYPFLPSAVNTLFYLKTILRVCKFKLESQLVFCVLICFGVLLWISVFFRKKIHSHCKKFKWYVKRQKKNEKTPETYYLEITKIIIFINIFPDILYSLYRVWNFNSAFLTLQSFKPGFEFWFCL